MNNEVLGLENIMLRSGLKSNVSEVAWKPLIPDPSPLHHS